MKLKFRFDPALKNAFILFFTYLRKVTFFKFLLIRPFFFFIKIIRKIFVYYGIYSNSRLMKIIKVIKFFIKLITTLIGFGIILAYNDLNLQEPVVYLAIIYAKLVDFFSNRLLGYIKNFFTILYRKFVDFFDFSKFNIDPQEDNSKSKASKTESKPRSYDLGDNFSHYYNSSGQKCYIYDKIIEDKPFYYNPYFYIPAALLVTSGIAFYIYLPTIKIWLVTSGWYGWWIGNNLPPRRPDSPDLPLGPNPSYPKTVFGGPGNIYNEPDFVTGSSKDNTLSPNSRVEYDHYFRSPASSPEIPETGPSGETIWSAPSDGEITPKAK